MTYERTQRGWWLVAIVLGAAAFTGALTFTQAAEEGPIFVSVMMGIIAGLIVLAVIFSSMTIRVSAGRIDWWLGFRLFHRVVNVADIEGTTSQRIPLIAGLGVKTSDGKSWLVIVGGSTAISLELRNGRTLMLGTPEPERVAAAIREAR